MSKSAILIEVSPGELIDKLTILEIKLDRIDDAQKRRNVEIEHAALRAAYEAHVPVPRRRSPPSSTGSARSTFTSGRSRTTFAIARAGRSSDRHSWLSRARSI